MEHLLTAIGALLTPWPFFLVVLGTFLGITVGAMPGLTTGMLILLTIPLTFTMDPVHALILLISMYIGGISGGQISAVLLGMPGTPAAVLTTFDGFPLARQGQPGRALGLGIGASFIGGMISWLFLVMLAKPIADVSVYLGPFDYFSLVLMAMVLIAAVSRGSLIKGLISGFFGMMVVLPGIDPAAGGLRLTFGFHAMDGGFKLMPILMGVFVIGQVLSDIVEIRGKYEPIVTRIKGSIMSLRDIKVQGVNLVRSSFIGTWIGILPGIGGNIGSIVAYTVAKNFSRTPEKFGHGSEEGLVASETANNATICGALIPLISLGIPGSIVDVFLISGMMVHNVDPGPLLSTSHPDIFYGIIAAALLANIVMFLIMTGAVGFVSRLMIVKKEYILPVIVVLSVIGAYAEGNRLFDVWVLMGFGAIGFVMHRASIPKAPFIIGAVLAPIAEVKLRSGLQISGGDFVPLITSPFSAVCLLISLGFLMWPLVGIATKLRKNAEHLDGR